MPTAYAKINFGILNWARERAQLSIPMLAKKLAVNEEKILAWEAGKNYPTFKQAQNFATKTHIPLGYLYLKNPPEEVLPIPDLRTVGGEPIKRPSAELIDIVQIILQRQQWYREYLSEQGAVRQAYVGSFTVDTPVQAVVDDIRRVLNVDRHPARGSWEEYFNLLVGRIEESGTLVMRQGDVGHHSRPLSVAEFRGFAISDDLAPVIFVNQADAPNPRLFTLIHELAHIWLGKSGVSDAKPRTQRQEEIQCNAIAGEFLVPREEFLALWQDVEDWKENLPTMKDRFHVSSWVIARRAFSLNKISLETYQAYVDGLESQYRNREKKSGGPTYYVTKKSQISNRFSKALISETLSGRVLLRDAGQLLNIKPHKISTFAKEFGL